MKITFCVGSLIFFSKGVKLFKLWDLQDLSGFEKEVLKISALLTSSIKTFDELNIFGGDFVLLENKSFIVLENGLLSTIFFSFKIST